MIDLAASLKATGGARSGLAPVNLLDVQDVNGNIYYWSDRKGLYPNGMRSIRVPGTTMPWDPDLAGNASFQWGSARGTAPILAASGLVEGQRISVSASGTITAGPPASWPEIGPYDSSGTLPRAGTVPLQYAPDYSNDAPIALTVFMGAFTDDGGNLVEAVAIGDGANLLTPAGATRLQLGINDDNPGDNTGAFSAFVDPIGPEASIVTYQPWLLDVPQFAFHRSLQTDTGSFVVQNLSGDTLSRDTEKILCASTLEGALFVYRLWQADAEAAWLEIHGTLTVDAVGASTLTLKGAQLINPSQDDTPLENYGETCQIDYGGRRCGATSGIECKYSFQTCQVVERIMVVLNHFEKNFGQATASTAQKVINRRRKI